MESQTLLRLLAVGATLNVLALTLSTDIAAPNARALLAQADEAGFVEAFCSPGEMERISFPLPGSKVPQKIEFQKRYPPTKCKRYIQTSPGNYCVQDGACITKDGKPSDKCYEIKLKQSLIEPAALVAAGAAASAAKVVPCPTDDTSPQATPVSYSQPGAVPERPIEIPQAQTQAQMPPTNTADNPIRNQPDIGKQPAQAQPSTPPAQNTPPPIRRIDEIANQPPAQTPNNPGNTLQRPFLLQPDIFNKFVSTVGGNQGGGGSSGGSYAYVPVQNTPASYDRGYLQAPQSTFAAVGPNAGQSLDALAMSDEELLADIEKNLDKYIASAPQKPLTAQEIAASMQGEAEQGVTQGTLTRLTTAISEGAGNATSIFVNTVFGAIAELFGASPQPQREQGEEEVDEFTQSLRDFELELVPGDPLTLDGTPRDEEGRPVSAQLDINPFGNAVAAAKEPSSESGGGGNWFSDLGAFLGVGGEEEPINVPGDPVAANEPQYAPSAEELAYLAEKDEAKEGGLIDSMLFTVKTTAKFFGGLLSSLFSGFASLFQFN